MEGPLELQDIQSFALRNFARDIATLRTRWKDLQKQLNEQQQRRIIEAVQEVFRHGEWRDYMEVFKPTILQIAQELEHPAPSPQDLELERPALAPRTGTEARTPPG